MLYLLALTVSTYTLCCLLQLPLSVPKGHAYDSARWLTWVVCLAGALIVAVLGLAIVASMLSQPTGMRQEFPMFR